MNNTQDEIEKENKWDTIYKCLHESGLVLFEPDGIIVDEETGETENVGIDFLIFVKTCPKLACNTQIPKSS